MFVDCEIPPDPEFGTASVSIVRNTVTYTCDVGYRMIGAWRRVCQTDGRGWTLDPPTCRMYIVLVYALITKMYFREAHGKVDHFNVCN